MANLQILKDSFSFAWKSTTKYFFKWLGYIALAMLPLMVVGTLLIRKLILMGWFGPNLLPMPEVPVVFSSTEYCLYAVGMLIALYLTVSFVTVLMQNMFDLYDGKEFRGFENPLASYSVILVIFLQTFVVGALTYPGMKYISLMFGGGAQKASALNSLVEGALSGPYGWLALLTLIPAFYIGLRIILSYYVVVDTGCSAIDAVKKSWSITGSHLRLFTSFYVICALVNAIPFVFIFTTPFCMLAYVYAYRAISK